MCQWVKWIPQLDFKRFLMTMQHPVFSAGSGFHSNWRLFKMNKGDLLFRYYSKIRQERLWASFCVLTLSCRLSWSSWALSPDTNTLLLSRGVSQRLTTKMVQNYLDPKSEQVKFSSIWHRVENREKKFKESSGPDKILIKNKTKKHFSRLQPSALQEQIYSVQVTSVSSN